MRTLFIRFGLILLLAAPLRAQVDSSGAAPAAVATGMAIPSPVSVEGASLAFADETERSNYLWGGLSFGTAYDNDFITRGVSDIGYSVRPSIAIDKSGSRLRWNLFYSPGFTFYQRQTLFSQSDHDLTAQFQYRVSPHITFTVKDTLTKSSALSYHFDPNSIEPGSGILQSPNQSIISPVADTIYNNAISQITYQFAANDMIGSSVTETEQLYLNRSQVPGLFNSSTRGAMAFYTHRLVGKHYIGLTYQFQQLLSHPNGTNTQTHGAFLFYQAYLNSMFSVALFGGPQYFEISRLGDFTKPGWSPAGGITLGWQRLHTSGNFSFTHRVSDGGGLLNAVISDDADLSIRRQLTRDLTISVDGSYTNNRLLDSMFPGNGGHTVSGTIAAGRAIGEYFNLQLGYTRAHQSYGEIPALSSVPDRNRVWAAITYNFRKPLGR